MSKQTIFFGGWFAEIEYQYIYIPAKLYGEMEDCYPEESSFDCKVLSYAIDDPDDHCSEDVIRGVLSDDDAIYDLLDMTADGDQDEE